MESITKDQAQGSFQELEDILKEIFGKPGDNPTLEVEGIGENITDKIHENISQLRHVLGKW